MYDVAIIGGGVVEAIGSNAHKGIGKIHREELCASHKGVAAQTGHRIAEGDEFQVGTSGKGIVSNR